MGAHRIYIAALGDPVLQVPVAAVAQTRGDQRLTLRPRSAGGKARLAAEIERVVWPWITDRRVRAVVDRTLPLAQAAAAHAFLESRQHTGKVVLVVGSTA